MLPTSPFTPTPADFDRFEELLLQTVDTQLVRRRRHHRAIVAASAVLLLAGGTTAWVALASTELQSLSAYCYSEADTASAFTQVGSPTDQIAPDGTITSVAPVADPAAAAVTNCAAVWAIDLFGTATNDGFEPLNDDGTGAGSTLSPTGPPAATAGPITIPRLQACLRPDGVYSVFPVPTGTVNTEPDDFCAAVGLARPYTP